MKFTAAIGALFFLSLTNMGGAWAHSLASFQNKLAEDEPGYTAIDLETPGFLLADMDGNIVDNESLNGKVVILYFICVECVDSSSEQGQLIARLQSMINISAMRDLVQFIGIVRGADDSGQFTRNYEGEYGLDSINWTLLFGDEEQLSNTEQLSLQFALEGQSTDRLDIVTHIIGIEGRWSGFFNGDEFNTTNLVILVNALTNVNSAENDGHADEVETSQGFWSRTLGILGIGS
ncbi:MAG: hypothetical protein L3J21_03560 [Devosiaceae bacterium]|nr:hypothetical protein [Devosiaceae bacterium]